jgi:hypothetical protein
MKQCTKCLKSKEKIEFSNCKANKDGLQYKCKQCEKEIKQQRYKTDKSIIKLYYQKNKKIYAKRDKQYAQARRLPYYVVYILPVHHYAGITNDTHGRMIRHKNLHQRDTTGWYEVARYNTRKEALLHEAQLHSQGYNGMNPKHQVISVLK